MATEFGDWLLGRLAEKDWSQAQLARKAKVSRQVIYNYINLPRENPDKDMLASIARALDLPPETVFRAAGLLPELPSIDQARQEIVLHKFSELSAEEQEQVIEYIDFIKRRQKSPTSKQNREGVAPPETFKRNVRT